MENQSSLDDSDDKIFIKKFDVNKKFNIERSIELKHISTEPGTTLISPKNSNSLEMLQKVQNNRTAI